MFGVTLGLLQATLPEPAHATDTIHQISQTLPVPVTDLSNEAPIWENVLRYTKYFFSVMLGTGYVMLKPLGRMLKNPFTTVFGVGLIVGTYFFVKITVNAMLGVEDLFEYEPGSFLINPSAPVQR